MNAFRLFLCGIAPNQPSGNRLFGACCELFIGLFISISAAC